MIQGRKLVRDCLTQVENIRQYFHSITFAVEGGLLNEVNIFFLLNFTLNSNTHQYYVRLDVKKGIEPPPNPRTVVQSKTIF